MKIRSQFVTDGLVVIVRLDKPLEVNSLVRPSKAHELQRRAFDGFHDSLLLVSIRDMERCPHFQLNLLVIKPH